MAIPFLPRRDDEPEQDGPAPEGSAHEDLDRQPTAAGDDLDGELDEAAPLGWQTESDADDDHLLDGVEAPLEPDEVTWADDAAELTATQDALEDQPGELLASGDGNDVAMERQVDMSTDEAAAEATDDEPAQSFEPTAEEPLDPDQPEPVHAVGPAPEAPEGEFVPPLGVDHAEALLAERQRDRLRPGGGPEMARPARVIALANQKGGVGKTTTTINLGAALAELGARVLLVDIDPQGSLGVGLGADPHSLEATVYNLLLMDGTGIDEVLMETKVENLHLLPANIDLAAAELLLVQEVAREQALRRVIERVQYRYDFVLIDCPPSLGLLTINGLTAADAVIVPLEAEYFALRGMTLLMQTLEKVQLRLNPQLQLEGIVATMFDGRTLHAREVLERVRAAFGDTVFKTTINKTIRFAEAPVAGEPILTYRPRSKGSDAYRDLAREVLAREPSS